jgi:two-component system KDP operon response regulator KdpE
VYLQKHASTGRNVANVKSARPCILLVEDEEINRVLVRTILRRSTEEELRDVELVEAGNLAAARTNLAEHAVDVMLVDLQLPDGSGLGLVCEIVAEATPGGSARPAIIALTGDVAAERRAEALAAGCDAFLDKPYTAAELRSTLVGFLRD